MTEASQKRKLVQSTLLQIIMTLKPGESRIYGPVVNNTQIQAAIARAKSQYGFDGRISQKQLVTTNPRTMETRRDTYEITRVA